MTTTTPAAQTAHPTTVPTTSAAERAERLTRAGQEWSERIAADRTSAHLTSRATAAGVGTVATTVRAGRHAFIVDEPAALAGDDAGPSPVDYVLGALAGCQVVVYRLYAQTLGIPFDEIAVTAEADLDAARLLGADDSVRPGFSEVRIQITLSGEETQERYEVLRAAVDANCPVLDIIENPVPVRTTVTRG